MDTKKMKATELIIDWSLWPRHEAETLDYTNLVRMKEALRAGIELPPIVIDKKSLRVIDGFHRVRAVLEVLGDNAEIDVEPREYKNDAAMFIDAARLNASQGLVLSPKDRAHVIIRAKRFKIPIPAIAEALGMRKDTLLEFLEKRTAMTKDGERIALSYGASKSLAGKKLNEDQEHFARTANGCLPEMYISMLLNALRANAVKLSEKTKTRLIELRDEIDEILQRAIA